MHQIKSFGIKVSPVVTQLLREITIFLFIPNIYIGVVSLWQLFPHLSLSLSVQYPVNLDFQDRFLGATI